MRVLCIGLDARVAQPNIPGHAITWTREISRLVGEYVVLAEGRDGAEAKPVKIADNATAYLVPCNPVNYPFAAAAFAEKLHRQEPFDLCTTEDPIRSGLAGALFAKRNGVPLNVENHSLHINEPAWLHWRAHHRIYNQIGIWVAKQAGSVRNYSPDQDPAILQLGIPQDRVFCVPPPFPATPQADRLASRKRLNLEPGDRMVLGVGRMVPYKNIGTLLDAFAAIRHDGPSRLFLVGDGPCRHGWENHAHDLGIADAVTWVGQAPEADMAAYYAAADVFVAPALHETGPRTILEAFAANCPVVATPRMGAVRYGICEDGETGCVVPPDDVRAIAHAIRSLLDNPEEARAMAAIGRDRALERCALGRVARDIASVFRETVQRARLEAAVRGTKGILASAD